MPASENHPMRIWLRLLMVAVVVSVGTLGASILVDGLMPALALLLERYIPGYVWAGMAFAAVALILPDTAWYSSRSWPRILARVGLAGAFAVAVARLSFSVVAAAVECCDRVWALALVNSGRWAASSIFFVAVLFAHQRFRPWHR